LLVFAYIWGFLLLPLPLMVRWFLPAYREMRPAVRIPFFQRLAQATGQQPDSGAAVRRRTVLQGVLYSMAWCAVVTALARPQWLEPPIFREVPTRDLLLAIDLSGSMEAEDVTGRDGSSTDRLTAVKEVLDDFLGRRQGDRVGIIVFGTEAFVQAPFTEDLAVCRELVQETAARMAGPKTALGDAIGLSITLFERSTVEERVLIALTDGNDTGSRVPPTEAARIASDNGITIHTIAFGDPASVGEEQFDEETLKTVAQTTGGRYFYAADKNALEAIYSELNQIETRKVETITHRPRRDLFHWPLVLVLVVSIGYHLPMALQHQLRKRRFQNFSAGYSDNKARFRGVRITDNG
jgi:Ca-activated chloride channel family protein